MRGETEGGTAEHSHVARAVGLAACLFWRERRTILTRSPPVPILLCHAAVGGCTKSVDVLMQFASIFCTFVGRFFWHRGQSVTVALSLLLVLVSAFLATATPAAAGAAEHSGHHAVQANFNLEASSVANKAIVLDATSTADECHRDQGCCVAACTGPAFASEGVLAWSAAQSLRVVSTPTQSIRGLAAEPLRRPPRAISA